MVYRGDRGFHSDVIFTQKVFRRKASSNRFPLGAVRGDRHKEVFLSSKEFSSWSVQLLFTVLLARERKLLKRG